MKKIVFILITFLSSIAVNAQESKYWIYFQDKDIENYDFKAHLSENAIQNRIKRNIPLIQHTDIPVNSYYIRSLKKFNVDILSQSKWLNAVSAIINQEDIERLDGLPFVKAIMPIDNNLQVCNTSTGFYDTQKLDKTIRQMEAKVFQEYNLTGKGVSIGVIDAGFYKANERELLKKLFEDDRLVEIIDYVSPNKKKYFSEKETGLDGHGSQVLEMITGNKKTLQTGLATEATFYLARTDHGNKEWRGEEDNWIRAMERMDSLGVRLINTSLGYALGFDESSENYSPKDMNGETSAIAKACKIATNEKGMFIVVSAGNEGNVPSWKIVSTPGDVKGVISVGSTNAYGMKMGYSSIGPDFLPYLKPNVSCYALGGTSFAAPAVTGFVACLMQFQPEVSNENLFNALEKSSHLYPYGNNYLGYGIPKASKAISILKEEEVFPFVEVKEVSKTNLIRLEIEGKQTKPIVVFHKTDKFNVLQQDKFEEREGYINLKKPKKVKRSTIVFDQKIVEVMWK